MSPLISARSNLRFWDRGLGVRWRGGEGEEVRTGVKRLDCAQIPGFAILSDASLAAICMSVTRHPTPETRNPLVHKTPERLTHRLLNNGSLFVYYCCDYSSSFVILLFLL